MLTRRDFLLRLGSTTFGLSLAGCATLGGEAGEAPLDPFLQLSPIDRQNHSERIFFGDSPRLAHDLFLGREKASEKIVAEEKHDVVVIGGGIAGLFTAFLLRDLRPVVLEQSSRLGGNAQGQSWRGLDFSLGAAYFSDPPVGTPLHQLLIDQLNVDQFTVVAPGDDPVWLNGQLVGDLPQKYQRYYAKWQELVTGKAGALQIPERRGPQRKVLDKLDKFTLLAFLEDQLGAKLPPVLATRLEHFCWSAFAGSSNEISAAAGLNFLAAEFESIRTANGGNAVVTERIVQRLWDLLGPGAFRMQSFVTAIEPVAGGVRVEYLNPQRERRQILAKTAVVACPKFMVARLLRGIEPDRQKAIRRMHYRSYLVANVLVSKDVAARFFDLYLLGSGDTKLAQAKLESERLGASDLILGDYATPIPGATVLTLYRPFPFEGARVGLLADEAYELYRKEIEEKALPPLLPMLGLQPKDIVGIRLARWGHALPLAKQGFLKEKLPERITAPAGNGRIFFVQQDNWCLPCLETAGEEAIYYSQMVRQVLKA